MWRDIELDQVRAWTRAEWKGHSELRRVSVTGVSTDTRTLRRGEVFVALEGERCDGHDHLPEAVERGASAAVVDRRRMADLVRAGGSASPACLLGVDSPVRALGRMARHYRRRFDLPVIAITGSSGKTTVKEMIAAVLGRRFRVLKTPENENNEIGVPRVLLGLSAEHSAVVLELAARRVGDIAYLCRVAQPTIGVLLNIGTAHAGVFGSVERVAKAKGELLDEILEESCVALVNADDCVVAREAKRTKGRLLGFGWRRESHFSGEGLLLDQEGCGHFSLQNTSFGLRIPGRHNAHNALAALACARVCGVPLQEAGAALREFRPLSMRSLILEKRGVRVIDDCYNANPGSVRAALDLTADIAVPGRRVAVLGDMLELGEASASLHEGIGRHAAGRVDVLLGTGALSAHTVRGAREAGLDEGRALHFEDRAGLMQHLEQEVSAGDLVLVKGSRGMALESIVEAL